MNAEIDISNLVLTTERLILRPWRRDDLQDFYEYCTDPDVGPMAGWAPHQNVQESKKILDVFISGKKTLALEYEGKVVGSIGIEKYNQQELSELNYLKGRALGFVLSKDYWGRGLMPEAVREVLRYLFEEVKLDFVNCGHFVWNKQSKRVQEKCGFHYIKEINHETRLGTVERTAENILMREEWLEQRE